MCPFCFRVFFVQTTRNAYLQALCGGPLTDSNRRPPPYHGAPPASAGNLRQRISLVFALFSAWPSCERLPPVATAGIHKRSIRCCRCWRRRSLATPASASPRQSASAARSRSAARPGRPSAEQPPVRRRGSRTKRVASTRSGHVEHAAGWARHHCSTVERGAEARDVHAKRTLGRGRRMLPPQLVDQLVDGDGSPRLEQEQRAARLPPAARPAAAGPRARPRRGRALGTRCRSSSRPILVVRRKLGKDCLHVQRDRRS
jgi:hypothetical protein